MTDRGTVVVGGMVAGQPHMGGASWAVLQYVLGFRRLGFEVYLIEPVSELTPAVCDYFSAVTSAFGLDGRAALVDEERRETVGLRYGELPRDADIMLNVAGMLQDEALIGRIPVRIYLDLDPAFTQLWQHSGIDMRFEGHTHFITVGLALGSDDCSVPTGDRTWATTVPPVVLEEWPVADGLEHDALTTVANWRGYGSIEHEGIHYGQKAHSLRRFIELPRLTDERFELAVAIHQDETRDLEALAANDWELLDPLDAAGTPDVYRRFLQGSKAEFGIAKSGYVVSRCGWFSDRSACYLASGRPVLAQDTGFVRFLPTGEGLLSFRSVDDVLAAIESLRGDYEGHRGKARAIAEEFLDSDKVLTRLLRCL